MKMNVQYFGNDTDRGRPKYSETNLSNTNLTRTDLGSNSGLRCERLATNRQGIGTAFKPKFYLNVQFEPRSKHTPPFS